MITQHGIGNLARVMSVFEANPEYCHITLSKTGVSNFLVRFLDEDTKMVAEMSVKLVFNLDPVDVSYAENPDAVGLGYRNTFMLTHMDEPEIDKYWARRKKSKPKKETFKGMLGRMSKEVKATHLKDAKSLLASLA
jgi:hypothetical protein